MNDTISTKSGKVFSDKELKKLADSAAHATGLVAKLQDANLDSYKKEEKRKEMANKAFERYEKRRTALYNKELKTLSAEGKLTDEQAKIRKEIFENDMNAARAQLEEKNKQSDEALSKLKKADEDGIIHKYEIYKKEAEVAEEMYTAAKKSNQKTKIEREKYYEGQSFFVSTFTKAADEFHDSMAESSDVFDKFNTKLTKGVENILAMTMGSKKAAAFSAKAKEKALEGKGFVKDKAKDAAKAAVAPIGSVMDTMKNVLLGGFMFIAIQKIIEFVNSEEFRNIIQTIQDIVVPAIKWIWEKFGILGFLLPMLAVTFGPKIFKIIKGGILAVKIFSKALTIVFPMLGTVFGLVKAAFIKLMAGVKASILVPLSPILIKIAIIAAILYSLYETIKKGQEIFKKTGSVWKTVQYMLIHSITAPWRWLKNITAWILDKFGFKDVAKKLKDFDITETLVKFWDGIVDWIVGAWNGMVKFFKNFSFSEFMANLSAWFKKAWNKMIGGIASIGEFISNLNIMDKLYDWLGSLWTWLDELFTFEDNKGNSYSLFGWIGEQWNKILDFFDGLLDFSGLSKTIEGIGETIANFFNGIIYTILTWLSEKAGPFGDKLEEMAEDFKPKKREMGGSFAAGDVLRVNETPQNPRGEVIAMGQPGTVYTTQRTQSMIENALNKNAQSQTQQTSAPAINNIITDNSSQASSGFVSPVEMIINDKLFRAAHSYTC